MALSTPVILTPRAENVKQATETKRVRTGRWAVAPEHWRAAVRSLTNVEVRLHRGEGHRVEHDRLRTGEHPDAMLSCVSMTSSLHGGVWRCGGVVAVSRTLRSPQDSAEPDRSTNLRCLRGGGLGAWVGWARESGRERVGGVGPCSCGAYWYIARSASADGAHVPCGRGTFKAQRQCVFTFLVQSGRVLGSKRSCVPSFFGGTARRGWRGWWRRRCA